MCGGFVLKVHFAIAAPPSGHDPTRLAFPSWLLRRTLPLSKLVGVSHALIGPGAYSSSHAIAYVGRLAIVATYRGRPTVYRRQRQPLVTGIETAAAATVARLRSTTPMPSGRAIKTSLNQQCAQLIANISFRTLCIALRRIAIHTLFIDA